MKLGRAAADAASNGLIELHNQPSSGAQGLVHISPSVTGKVTTERGVQLIDLTDIATGVVDESGITEGILYAFCPHTTCGLMINERESGFHLDLEEILEEIAPRSRYWAHDDTTRRWENLEENLRANGFSHIRSALVSQSSATVPIVGASLALGTWQRLFLVELDGGRERNFLLRAWGIRK